MFYYSNWVVAFLFLGDVGGSFRSRNLLPTALTVSTSHHQYRYYSLFIARLLSVILFLLPPQAPSSGAYYTVSDDRVPKWSPIIQTPNPRSSAAVAVCPRPYPGLVVSETPFLLSQVFLTPDSRPPYCFVCISCTHRTSIVFPAGSLAPTLRPLPRVLRPFQFEENAMRIHPAFPPTPKRYI